VRPLIHSGEPLLARVVDEVDLARTRPVRWCARVHPVTRCHPSWRPWQRRWPMTRMSIPWSGPRWSWHPHRDAPVEERAASW